MSSDARRRYGLVLRMLRGIVMLCVLAMFSLALAFPSEEMPSFVLSLPFFQFVPAMLSLSAILVCGFLLSALVFGRVYCSFWCPLGIVQDLVRAVARLFNVVPLKIRPSVRYGLAAAGGALALLGAAWLFDPYGIFSRALVLLTIPHVQVPVAVGMWGLLCIAHLFGQGSTAASASIAMSVSADVRPDASLPGRANASTVPSAWCVSGVSVHAERERFRGAETASSFEAHFRRRYGRRAFG